jgi:glutamine amidotransferase
LLDQLAQHGGQLADEKQWRWLHSRLAELNQLGKLNCLLSDGVRLFVYHDAAGYKGLTFRKVHIGSDQLRRFEDSQVQIDVEGESINQGYVVATHPLSESHWHPFHPGELIVLAGGQPVFSSHRRPKSATETSKEHS